MNKRDNIFKCYHRALKQPVLVNKDALIVAIVRNFPMVAQVDAEGELTGIYYKVSMLDTLETAPEGISGIDSTEELAR